MTIHLIQEPGSFQDRNAYQQKVANWALIETAINGLNANLHSAVIGNGGIIEAKPDGIYNTLDDLKAAYPSGNTGVYLNLADGHWYYWNGSAWTDGGIYQATGIGTNAIKLENLDETSRSPFIPSVDIDSHLQNKVLYLKLIGASTNKTYYISAIHKNWEGTSVLNIACADNIDGKKEVCQFTDKINSHAGIELINLSPVNQSAIYGKAIVNWDADSLDEYQYNWVDSAKSAIDSRVCNADSKIKNLPFSHGISDLLESIQEIILINADPSKHYYISYIQRNLDGKWNVTIGCDEIDQNIDSAQTACQFLSNIKPSDVSYAYLTHRNESGVFAVIKIDWTKFTEGVNYHFTYATAPIDKSCIISDSKPFYPFRVPNSLNSFILDIQIFNADRTKQYFISHVSRNDAGKWQINVKQQGAHEVCQFSEGGHKETGNIEVIRLNTVLDSGIYGIIKVDWSKLTDQSSHDFSNFEETWIDDRCISGIIIDSPNDKNKNRLILPDYFYLLKGMPLNLYKNSIIPSIKSAESTHVAISRNKIDYEYFENTLLSADDLSDKITIAEPDQNNNDDFYRKDISIIKTDPEIKSGKSLKMIGIGDSLTHNDVLAFLKKDLSGFNVGVNVLGTIYNGSATGSDGTVYSAKSEGRSGWSASTFIGRRNQDGDSNVITRVPDKVSSTTLQQNPFLKLADDTDKQNYPAWCFRNTGATIEKSYANDADKTGDFYIFSLKYYLETQQIDVPDIITIALGTNDFWQFPDDWLTSILLSINCIISMIKKDYPDIKVGIIPGQANANGSTFENNIVVEIENLCQFVRESTFSNISIIPIWAHQSREFIFEGTSANYSEINNLQIVKKGDTTHFGAIGKEQYAKAFSAWVLNQI